MSSGIPSLLRNVREISAIEDAALRNRTAAQRLADEVAYQAGRIWFIQVHVVWFVAWVLFNSGKVPLVHVFDPFPYQFLTLVVSLEAIFLSLFILMSQNAANRQADRRAHLDLQINLLAEMEASKTLELLQAICRHLNLSCAEDPEVDDLICRTKPSDIISELKRNMPTEGDKEDPMVSLT